MGILVSASSYKLRTEELEVMGKKEEEHESELTGLVADWMQQSLLCASSELAINDASLLL
jgi:hypothetical protein